MWISAGVLGLFYTEFGNLLLGHRTPVQHVQGKFGDHVSRTPCAGVNIEEGVLAYRPKTCVAASFVLVLKPLDNILKFFPRTCSEPRVR